MKLSKEIKELAMVYTNFAIILNYINIFVNLFIWEKSHKIADNALYNLLMYGVLVVFLTFGTKIVMKTSLRVTTGLSSLFATLSFLSLLLFHPTSHFLWLASIAIPIGIMQGFFWSGLNVNVSFYGKGKDFEGYFAITNLTGQAVNIVIPLLSGFIIQYFGFGSSFIVMLLFVTTMLILAFRVPKLPLAKALEGDTQLFNRQEIIGLFRKRGLRWSLPANTIAMLFYQFQFLFALIFTFSITDNKVYIALLNVGYTICCMIALQLYKKVKGVNQSQWLFIGVSLIAVGFLLVLFPKSPVLVTSNVLTTIGMFYYSTIFNAQQYEIIEHEKPINKIRVLILKEWLFAIGRVAIFGLIYFVKDYKGVFFYSLLAVAILSAFGVQIFQRKSMSEYKNGSVSFSEPVSGVLKASGH